MLVTNFNLKYALYKIVLPLFQLYDTGQMHPVRERANRSLQRTVDYIDAHMSQAIGFETQKELILYALNSATVPGVYLEFGVFTGGTIRFMAKKKPGVLFHGFDSFEGLPEDWFGMPLIKNSFSLNGRLPKVPKNVMLHKGWFSESLALWCRDHQDNVAFVHIDCDLYSSTVDILEGLVTRLQKGTIILFDEYFNYPNWENHEYKAWQEFVRKYNLQYDYIGFARQQVAVKITSVCP
ncbi:MAG: TylF/MycF family methyltransferase [Gammaproteobacteria bacterium]|nr:TylF/MycF family methyltransferase [Gammaproteobacteria bacterium]